MRHVNLVLLYDGVASEAGGVAITGSLAHPLGRTSREALIINDAQTLRRCAARGRKYYGQACIRNEPVP